MRSKGWTQRAKPTPYKPQLSTSLTELACVLPSTASLHVRFVLAPLLAQAHTLPPASTMIDISSHGGFSGPPALILIFRALPQASGAQLLPKPGGVGLTVESRVRRVSLESDKDEACLQPPKCCYLIAWVGQESLLTHHNSYYCTANFHSSSQRHSKLALSKQDRRFK